jgi:phage terminase large subunit GpA-like protein
MASLRASVSAAWRPRERVSPSEWIGARVKLSDLEAQKGPYDLDDRPWWKEILDSVGDPTVRTIAIPASTQVGKTLALCAVILYLAENAPASALLVVPTADDAKEIRERLYRLAQESGLWIPPEGKWNTRYLQIGAMRIYLAWSGSRQRMRGRRCKYVFLTEIDVFDSGRGGDPIEAAKQRVKAFLRHLIWAETSPVPETSRIEQIEQEPERQRRRWQCECPDCGTWQEVRFFGKESDAGLLAGFGGLKNEHGQTVDPETARDEAHYVCVQGCVIGNDRKDTFLRSGRWVPQGCSIDADGELTGDAERSCRDLGFQLWSVHSHVTWGTIAAEYCRAVRDGGLPDWWQNWFGRSHKTRGSLPTWEQLGRRLAMPYYFRGTVVESVWFLTAGIDVQEREVYAVVRGWGDQQTSWLVDWFVMERTPGDETDVLKSDLLQLDELVMGAWFPLPAGLTNPRGRSRLQVALAGIDANYRTLDVHEWIRHHQRSPRIRAVRGDAQLDPALRYTRSVLKESRREKDDGTGPVVYEGGLELWRIAVEPFRMSLVERFRAPDSQTKPGAWLLPGNVVETGRHYLRQLVNEPPTYMRGKDGRPKLVFREIDHHLGHDFWDCEVISLATAQMVVDQIHGNPGWDAGKWDRGEVAQAAAGPKVKTPRRTPENRAAR